MKKSKRSVKKLINKIIYEVNTNGKSLYKELKKLLDSEANRAYHRGFYEGLSKIKKYE